METSGRRWRFLVSGSRLKAGRPFGNLATRVQPGLACGPMALRRRLTAVLPLSRMARLTRFVPIRGKVPETVNREHPRTVTPKT